MKLWQAHPLEIAGILFLIGIAGFPRFARLIALVALYLLPTPFDALTKLGLLSFPYLTVSLIAWQMYGRTYPALWVPALVIGLCGTVSEINRVNQWLRKTGFVARDRKLLSDYVWELFVTSVGVVLRMSVKTLGIILLLAVIIAVVGLAVFGISLANAMFFFGCIAVPLAGTILYFIRMNHRFWFGVSEITFAVLLAVFTIYKSFDTSDVNVAKFFTEQHLIARVLALSTSVYIVVRGWDNIGEERAKSLLDRIRRRRLDKE